MKGDLPKAAQRLSERLPVKTHKAPRYNAKGLKIDNTRRIVDPYNVRWVK